MPLFRRYIAIDYSGAATPVTSLKGLRIYVASPRQEALEVPPPPSPRKYWTRRGIAAWLVERFKEPVPTLAGIDHSGPSSMFTSSPLLMRFSVENSSHRSHLSPELTTAGTA